MIRESTVSWDGGRRRTFKPGMLHGRVVYERLYELSDPTDTLDPVDGKAGYYDRWAGQGKTSAYEDAAALYIIGELESGLEVFRRFTGTKVLQTCRTQPEAYKYKGVHTNDPLFEMESDGFWRAL